MFAHQSEWFIWGLPSSTATTLWYTTNTVTYVTGPNQSGSFCDRPPRTPLLESPQEVQFLAIVLELQEYYNKNCTSHS